ncbi:AAA family ATPase [Thermodesulfobium sp. 4217-1]|uniref:bifunctional aminoglycoside phosphotransferase/ATP-binding protein n=1 Tax=Thermodesulfobium sp. 4217-1 TaxID=3120013 RepID=UPI0032215863
MPNLVNAMLNPSFYPHEAEIKFIETHISCVFLTGKYAYKIKKSVNFGFLDFSTLEKRKNFCEQEIKLNSRINPSLYLGVMPISLINSSYVLNSSENIVEYCIKMVELPQDSLMSNLLIQNKVFEDDINRIAQKVVQFHDAANKIKDTQFVDSIKYNLEENFSQTENIVGWLISKKNYNLIMDNSLNFFNSHKSDFEDRMKNGLFVDGHGDLHSKNISIMPDDIYIFDCIEFNERFRIQDISSEVSFLSMDLDFSNKSDLSAIYVNTYQQLSKKNILPYLDFFKSYLAYVRGKVLYFSFINDQKNKDLENAIKRYFRLSAKYFNNSLPTIFVISGLSGTGKSALAKRLSSQTDIKRLSSDEIRKELAGVPKHESAKADYNAGIYSPDFTKNVYSRMLEQTEREIQSNRSVILDATFNSDVYRNMIVDLAKKLETDMVLIEREADFEIIAERLKKRALKRNTSSDADLDIYRRQLSEYKPWNISKGVTYEKIGNVEDLNELSTLLAKKYLMFDLSTKTQ